MPNSLSVIVEQTRQKVRNLLAAFCNDTSSRNCGGFVDTATGWADTRQSIYQIHNLFVAYLYLEFTESHANDELLNKLRLFLDFLKRRQFPDGSIALGASGIAGGNEVGFTLPAMCEPYLRSQFSTCLS